jgi:hypothetical protein
MQSVADRGHSSRNFPAKLTRPVIRSCESAGAASTNTSCNPTLGLDNIGSHALPAEDQVYIGTIDHSGSAFTPDVSVAPRFQWDSHLCTYASMSSRTDSDLITRPRSIISAPMD